MNEARRRDMVVVACLVLGSVVAVFALARVSTLLNLRGITTQRQQQRGTVAWLLSTGFLVLGPAYIACRRRAPLPRWLTVSAWGLIALLVLQIASIVAFLSRGVLLSTLLPDDWIGVVALAAGAIGVYTFGSGAVVASRDRRRGLAIARWAGTAASAVLVVVAVWGCLFFE